MIVDIIKILINTKLRLIISICEGHPWTKHHKHAEKHAEGGPELGWEVRETQKLKYYRC